ncbi:MAG: FRG domain-containing protein [Anaerolineales bacterium]|jgi:hypothetical protein|nr:FRG domain-containing protein [Anaerolineales bacterium]MDX9937789.1 FRG domain-containing protein [Anaerolineales bacterium]GER80011.1 conserved hypothetical protein [Candidatus Denitrolinea symbiosum]
MNNKILSITANSWESARKLADHLGLWSFRGQEDATWDLESSAERARKDNYESREHPRLEIDMEAIEAELIYEMKRRVYHYVPHPPADSDNLEWLALLQHYGCPTRLLDFTHSFYVAAFFSVETAKTDSAIWAVDHSKIDLSLNNKLGLDTTLWSMDLSDVNKRKIEVVEGYIGQEKRDHNLVVDVEPIHLSERVSIQQGLFLFPLNADVTFMQNLLATFDILTEQFGQAMANPIRSDKVTYEQINSASVIKLILPKGCHATTIFDLKEMNITAATLFPGLDGYARSLKIRFRYPVDDDLYNNWREFKSRSEQ